MLVEIEVIEDITQVVGMERTTDLIGVRVHVRSKEQLYYEIDELVHFEIVDLEMDIIRMRKLTLKIVIKNGKQVDFADKVHVAKESVLVDVYLMYRTFVIIDLINNCSHKIVGPLDFDLDEVMAALVVVTDDVV